MTQPAIVDGWRARAKAGDSPTDGPKLGIFKQFTTEVEALADRRVKFTVTTSTPDRERDVLETVGIDTASYERNPVVQWAHDYKSLPIGRCVAIERSATRLVATVEFASAELNPMADQIFRMVKAGFINACSIGFRPLEWTYDEDRGGVNFLKSEMLEFSVCPIPANAEALVAAHAAGIDTSVLKGWAERVLATYGEVDFGGNTVVLLHGNERIVPRSEVVAAGLSQAAQASISRTAQERLALLHARVTDEPVRWNQLLSKSFDVAAQEFPARSIEQDLAAKYCACQVKDLYHRFEAVYSTRMGAFLSALDETIAGMQVDDVRNLGSDGREEPPLYESIQLNSTRTQEFLVDGLRFMQWNGVKLALRVEPRWYGLQVTTYAERKHAAGARAVFDKTFARAKELNFLNGEAFSLSGEFLTRGTTSFDDIFLDAKNQKIGQRIMSLINERGAQLENRGVIMLGPPGNGKTLLGRILMDQAKATFVWCSARDFYYGGGFHGLANAFEIARESAAAGTPAILFIEDVDNYLDGRTTDLMKTEMDGIAQSKGVVTILTTNYPELLPKALIDRPGRFHDVVRFDLPNAEARAQMLRKWLPELTGAALDDTVKELHGYSGAHVREFARFAGIIRDQDAVDVVSAAKSALAKLQEQRDLITSVQVQGSRYRAPTHVAEKALASEPEDIIVEAREATVMPVRFSRDAVGWKAFVAARSRATKKSAEPLGDDVIADMLEDYGFETEARTARTNRVAGVADALAPRVAKAGRVLSKANETKLVNARHACAAAVDQIDDVLRTVEREDEQEPVAAAAAQPVAKDDASGDDDVLVLSDDADEPELLIEISAGDDGDLGIELSADEPTNDLPLEVDEQLIGAAIRDGLRDLVHRETVSAINGLRGRID